MSSKLNGKTFTGVVVSDKTDKTIVVKVTRREAHPIYKKVITKTTKFHAHDPKNEANIGDTVLIQETKPVSKTKSSILVQILERAS